MTEEPKKPTMVDRIADLLRTTEHLQWYTDIRMKAIQANKLKALVAHHMKNNPWFAVHAGNVNIPALSVDAMHLLPLIKRQQVQTAGAAFFAEEIPESHKPVGTVKTSGSTGEPVVIQATNLVSMFFHALNLLEIPWMKRNPNSRLAVIKAGQFQTRQHPSWGVPVSALMKTGELLAINITEDVVKQAQLLEEFKPDILLAYPNNLAELLKIWQANGNKPPLKHIKTVGETVSDDLRESVRAMFGLEIEDAYSSQELGTIAMQCKPGQYHTMDVNLIVEVLDDQDTPVAEGEMGRVVVTDLHNYASPMIRYDIGDYAVRGGACDCGRGFGTLQKIVGRERNLILRADGSRYWPMVGMYEFDTLDFIIRRYQVIQHDRELVEYKIVTDLPLTADQESALRDIAQRALGPEFVIKISRQAEDFQQKPNGKFEEFVCHAVP